MRFVAEYLENTSQILLRLLSMEDGAIQLGSYLVDARPRVPETLRVDIESDAIKNGEAHFYLTGFWPLPDWIEITPPDLIKQKVKVVTVVTRDSAWEPLLAEQPLEALTPIAQEPLRPAESQNRYKPEKTIPAEYPQFFAEISLERSDPVRLGTGITSDPITYVGGGRGRALSSTQRQLAADQAPYINHAPTRLEGLFTNSLVNSDFSYSPAWSSPYFDQQPNGWTVSLADPMDLLRFQTSEPSAVLPSFTLRYRQRTGRQIRTSGISVPPVSILTPPITNMNETFQAILLAGAKNAEGRVYLETEDGDITSQTYNLIDGIPVVATLNVGTHTGRVKLVWDITADSDGDEQILQIIAPSAAIYEGGHSWIPQGTTSKADVITVDNISYSKPWFFNKGTIRIDGQGEPSQPYSWEIKLGTETLLKVAGGVLSSSFMASNPVLLSSYLSDVTRYKLTWSSPTSFSLIDFSGGEKVTIPFYFDLSAIEDSMLPLSIELTSFKENEGSLIIKRWAWLPI